MAPGANVKTNGAAPKGAKPAKVVKTPSPLASGTATPVSEEAPKLAGGRLVRPEKKDYDAEQETIKSKIAEVQEKMTAIQSKINAGSNSGPGAERRTELRTEWDKIRQEQAKFKNSRGQLFTQLQSLNEAIEKKVKDLQAAKGKTQFKSVADVDAHIKQLEKLVDSGSMKIVEEKRALAEISSCKRLRRTVESFQADQEAIDRDRAAIAEIHQQLDDPEAKALSEHADEVKAELDQIRKDSDEAYSNRNKLFEERNEVKAQLDQLFNEKRESAARYREENDRYYAKINEERARRAERLRAQRQAEEEDKKKDIAQRLREEAAAPAYQAQIEDCQTLIDYLSGKTSSAIKLSTVPTVESPREVAGVPKLEIRHVESNTAGLVQRKKKGEEEDAYFVGGKGKRGRKGGAKASPAASNGVADSTPLPSPSGPLNIPLPTLSALLALSIPPPANAADVPRTVTDLQTKKAWFEANQERATAENVAKAEKEIVRLLGIREDGAPPNGKGENPPDPAPTPAETDENVASRPVSPEEVEAELDEVTKNVAELTA